MPYGGKDGFKKKCSPSEITAVNSKEFDRNDNYVNL